MLNESSLKRSSEELAGALDMLGSTISFGASSSQSFIKVSSLTEHLDATLALVEERLFSPGFLQADFDRVKQQAIQGLQHQLSDPNFIASSGFNQLLYGRQNPMGVSSSGTVKSLSAITLEYSLNWPFFQLGRGRPQKSRNYLLHFRTLKTRFT
jgi:zinc protease